MEFVLQVLGVLFLLCFISDLISAFWNSGPNTNWKSSWKTDEEKADDKAIAELEKDLRKKKLFGRR